MTAYSFGLKSDHQQLTHKQGNPKLDIAHGHLARGAVI